MKVYGDVGVWLHKFLTTVLNGGERSGSRLDRFTARRIASGTNWVGGCMLPRVGLDVLQKGRIACIPQELNYDSSVDEPVA
jgi:hypothetical protein